MNTFFDNLEVGDELETRETMYSPWMRAEVTEKNGDSITVQNDDVGEIESDRDEVNAQMFFRPIY